MTVFDRRAFLTALGAVPVAAALASCSTENAARPATTVDLAGADSAIRPQDDLYRHVNGKWLREYQLPPDKSRFGSFSEVAERTEQQLREILESIKNPAAGSEEQKLHDFYTAYLDTAGLDKLGLEPVKDLLAKVDGAADKTALVRVMGELAVVGVSGVTGLYIGADKKDSNRYLPYLSQGGLGLPEKSYYEQATYAEQRTAYRGYLERLAKAAAMPDPAAVAGRMLDLETQIAAFHWDNVRTRDAVATYNVYPWAKLPELAPGLDWNAWLAPQTDKPEAFATVVVEEPTFLTGIAKLWNDAPLETWREYLRLSVIGAFATVLPKDVADAAFAFYSTALKGVTKAPDRWKLAVRATSGNLGDLLGKKYVAAHFPSDAKQRADALVANLREAYKIRFENTEWMSPATRTASIEKLNKITTKIGHPDTWRDYSALTVTQGQLVTSMRAGNVFEHRRQIAKLGKPVDRTEWHMSPQTVNAYYSQETNEIVFPAAILQAPFFDKDAEAALNYGAIGAVIGHEIGHGFDDQGSRYDGDGNLRDWWTPEDRAAFEKKTTALINQYNALVPEGLRPDQHVNGALTVGENLADLRGLAISLAAYRIDRKKEGKPEDDTQVFFSFARCWREKQSLKATVSQISTDPHSPDEFRCNQVVRNIAQFYTTFSLTPTDKLWLPEDQRVTI